MQDDPQLFRRVKIQAMHHAEPVAQGRGEQPGARGGAHQGERRQVQLHRARHGPLADDDVQLEVLHRRVEHLLHRPRQPVHLVDEQHVARLQVGQDRRQVALPLQHRARGALEAHAQLPAEHVGQRRLAQARGPAEQDVVQRLAALAGRLDEHLQIVLDFDLPHVLL